MNCVFFFFFRLFVGMEQDEDVDDNDQTSVFPDDEDSKLFETFFAPNDEHTIN